MHLLTSFQETFWQSKCRRPTKLVEIRAIFLIQHPWTYWYRPCSIALACFQVYAMILAAARWATNTSMITTNFLSILIWSTKKHPFCSTKEMQNTTAWRYLQYKFRAIWRVTISWYNHQEGIKYLNLYLTPWYRQTKHFQIKLTALLELNLQVA